ncbi:MAG: type II secretion system protein GspN [Thermodesulfobacteriota bacterium]
MKNITSKYLASIILFLLFLTLFFYLNFPTEALKKRIIAEIENSSGYKAEIEDLRISPFLVINLKKLNLSKEQNKTEILVDKLKISPSLISLLFETNKIPFSAQIGQGDVDGTINYSNKTNRLNSFSAKLNNVNSKIINEFLKNKKGVPEFNGEVNGEIDIILVKEGVENVDGEFNLYSDNFSLSNLKVEQFKLPEYKGLKAALEGTIEKNTTLLSKLQLENNDFNLILNGTMPVPWKMKKGVLDLSVNLVLNSNEAKMGFLKAFMKKGNDGSLSAKIAGTINKPQFIKGETL